MFTNKVFLLESFYNEKSELSIISSKVNQRISVKKPTHSVFSVNWHFNLRFVLKRTKTLDFVFITEILWRTFWQNNWLSVFEIVWILYSREQKHVSISDTPMLLIEINSISNIGCQKKTFLFVVRMSWN